MKAPTPNPAGPVKPPTSILRTAALAAVRATPNFAAAATVARRFPADLAGYLQEQRLTQPWAEALRRSPQWSELPSSLRHRLDEHRTASVGRSLVQQEAARAATEALARVSVPHAFMKGLELSQTLYGAPWIRQSDDVDVLVPAGERDSARSALVAAGFVDRPHRGVPTHEISLRYLGVTVDLHWHPFRPWRTRRDPTPDMLATRKTTGKLPTLSEAYELLMLTAATAISDYVSYRLVRTLDLDRWLRSQQVDWDGYVTLCRDLGVRVAAWAMLEWTIDRMHSPAPRHVLAALAPPALRRCYLRGWLASDPARVYFRSRAMARLGFSLALHDDFWDAWKAARERVRHR